MNVKLPSGSKPYPDIGDIQGLKYFKKHELLETTHGQSGQQSVAQLAKKTHWTT